MGGYPGVCVQSLRTKDFRFGLRVCTYDWEWGWDFQTRGVRRLWLSSFRVFVSRRAAFIPPFARARRMGHPGGICPVDVG